MIDWTETTLGSLVAKLGGEIKTGPFGTKLKAAEYTRAGAPLISVKEIQLGRIEVDEHTPRVPSSVQLAMPEYLLRSGDIVFARKGGIERSAWITPEQDGYFLGSDGLRVRLPASIDSRFVSFQVRSAAIQSWLLQHSTGSTMASLSGKVLALLPVRLPPLPEQRRIAAILGALDDKIELNRKMNRTLEAMAQALFKSWFIDFDGHDDLVDSEIGPVPRGWEVGSPDAFVEFDPTIPLRKGTEAVYADMKAIPTSGPAVSEWARRAYAGGTRFQQGDTLLARITPCLENGKSALVDFLADGEIAFGSTEFIVLRPRRGVPRVWPYCLVRHEPFRAHAIANMTGSSGRQRVSAGALPGFRLAVPPAEVLDRFGAVTDPLFKRITANTRESSTLADLRDTLLPKLISGELRVPGAEAVVAEAL